MRLRAAESDRGTRGAACLTEGPASHHGRRRPERGGTPAGTTRGPTSASSFQGRTSSARASGQRGCNLFAPIIAARSGRAADGSGGKVRPAFPPEGDREAAARYCSRVVGSDRSDHGDRHSPPGVRIHFPLAAVPPLDNSGFGYGVSPSRFCTGTGTPGKWNSLWAVRAR
jgi:hypothetical protein